MVILNIKTNKHSSITHTDILENIFINKLLLVYISTIRTKTKLISEMSHKWNNDFLVWEWVLQHEQNLKSLFKLLTQSA
jgi:hypothetical protein